MSDIPLRFQDLAHDEIEFAFKIMNDAKFREWFEAFQLDIIKELRPCFARMTEIARLTKKDPMFQRSVILYFVQRSDEKDKYNDVGR